MMLKGIKNEKDNNLRINDNVDNHVNDCHLRR